MVHLAGLLLCRQAGNAGSSAVCAFTHQAIAKAFNGKYKELNKDCSRWMTYSGQATDPRPGSVSVGRQQGGPPLGPGGPFLENCGSSLGAIVPDFCFCPEADNWHLVPHGSLGNLSLENAICIYHNLIHIFKTSFKGHVV